MQVSKNRASSKRYVLVSPPHAPGLVLGATDPLDNKLRLGNRNRGWVRVIADLGENRVMAVSRFDLTPKRWLVAGMEIPIKIDPGRPANFEIVWDAIPSTEERVATNDPTLADPISAQKALLAARGAAAAPAEPTLDRFRKAMKYAAEQPAPAGKTWAIIHVAAITATVRTDESSSEQNPSQNRSPQAGALPCCR